LRFGSECPAMNDLDEVLKNEENIK